MDHATKWKDRLDLTYLDRPVDGWVRFPARAAGGDFEGVWDTVIDEVNAHYRLYLHQDGNKVEGNFENEQAPKYNGRLSGTVKNGRLDYSYSQPKVKGEGTGYFTIGSDGTITGLTMAGRGLGKQLSN